MVEIDAGEQDPYAGPRTTAAVDDSLLPWWLRSGVGTLLGAVVLGIGWVALWEIPGARMPETPPRTVATRPVPSELAWVSADDDDPPDTRSGSKRQSVGATELVVEADGSVEQETVQDVEQEAGSDAVQPAEGPAEPAADEAARDPEARASRSAAAELRRARRADQELARLARSLPASLLAWASPLAPGYRITALFGARGARWSSTHTGLDLAVPTGTPVRAVGGGTVTFAGEDGAYGLRVEVTHPDGTKTWYAHLSRIDVAEGTRVAAGATLGLVGATGNVTGPHLHLEVRLADDQPTDPVTALRTRGVNLL